MLFPKPMQAQIAETVDDAGEALRLWLGAQLLAMIMVGILIGVGSRAYRRAFGAGVGA